MDFYFVPETGNIIYTALGKDVIEASVPNNVMVNNGVYAKSAGAMSQFTYKDGNIIATPSDYTYREPGYYDIVSFIYTDAGSSGTDEDAGAYAACTHFTFCILDKETSGIGVVNAPRGFHFTGIWFDGNPCNIPDTNAYFMREDGDYYVTYAADTDYQNPPERLLGLGRNTRQGVVAVLNGLILCLGYLACGILIAGNLRL